MKNNNHKKKFLKEELAISKWAYQKTAASSRILVRELIKKNKELVKRGEEREQLLKTIETSQEAMHISSCQGIISYTNPAAEELFGYKKGELIGKNFSSLAAGGKTEAARVMKNIKKAIEKKGVWQGEITHKKKNGQEFQSWARIGAQKDKNGKIIHFISTQHDITKQKKAEEKIRNYAKKTKKKLSVILPILQEVAGGNFSEKIKISQKSDEFSELLIALNTMIDHLRQIDDKKKELDRIKNEFISIASHQLGTPLVGIRWAVERILKKENLTIGLKGYLEDIHLSVLRLSALVADLLNVSRFEEGKIAIHTEKLELVNFIKEYIAEATPLSIKKGIALTFEEHPQTLEIIIDPNILRNVVQSLVSNAIEYTPKTGKVKLFLKKRNNCFFLAVSDTGIGIPKKEQTIIFEKFTRGSNARLIKPIGSGLGLYLAKQAVEMLKGKIWLDSKKNKGATFYVELPLKVKSKKRQQANGILLNNLIKV